eukprot:4099108-Amphidinium_carterae.1
MHGINHRTTARETSKNRKQTSIEFVLTWRAIYWRGMVLGSNGINIGSILGCPSDRSSKVLDGNRTILGKCYVRPWDCGGVRVVYGLRLGSMTVKVGIGEGLAPSAGTRIVATWMPKDSSPQSSREPPLGTDPQTPKLQKSLKNM